MRVTVDNYSMTVIVKAVTKVNPIPDDNTGMGQCEP
jgi:hypothetical protein